MADTKQHPAAPIEGDGVSYSGIAWFVVILVGTVVFCQLFVWGMFVFMESRAVKSDVARAPLAPAVAVPTITQGRVDSGAAPGSAPALLVDEPAVLQEFQKAQEAATSTYGWVNQGAEVVRLPIGRAKELVVERGLPVRETAAPAAR